MQENYIIDVKNLYFSYRVASRKVPVLKNLSFHVKYGEMLAIQGPSGQGKSTLLYLLGGLLSRYKGTISISGNNLNQFSHENLAFFRNQKLGFIFQQFHLLPKLNVLENILLPSFYPCERKRSRHILNGNTPSVQKAIDLCKQVGLEHHLHHLPSQLSGGQQQRVAICRALFNDPDIILADEPTGNLDSKSTAQILQLLKNFHKQGKTLIIITHENDVANECERIVKLKDGQIIDQIHLQENSNKEIHQKTISLTKQKKSFKKLIRIALFSLNPAWKNLITNKARSALTMLGIVIGVAAILAMMTLGQFTKEKILNSYAELGVNTLMFRGYPNWHQKATDTINTPFRMFSMDKDITPLKRIFPQIAAISPIQMDWRKSATFAGRVIENDIQTVGVNEQALIISNRKLLAGRNFTKYHIDNNSSVCLIGFDVGQRLFNNINPIGKMLQIMENQNSFACRILGVLESKTSNSEWIKPNLQIYLPYTFFQTTSNWWGRQIHEFMIQVHPDQDIEVIGKATKNFFQQKYGRSGRFSADNDSVLLSQMKKFLNLFTILLTSMALISLTVGGIGITNMMLVSISERLKEIGLRKAIGATNISIKMQLFIESLLLCSFAGFMGVVFGIACYQTILFGASKLVSKLQYEWVLNIWAVLFSAICVFLVGILSGFVPAIKAEKLEVIDALRSE